MIIEQEVSDLINKKATANNPRPRIYLTKNKFELLVDTLEPIYKEKYGALLVDERANLDGYDNILYKGCAVCLATGLHEKLIEHNYKGVYFELDITEPIKFTED